MPASTLMVKSCGSYLRTRHMADVEIVTLDSAAGPPIKRLEKLPPNSMVSRRLAAPPKISASPPGLSGRTMPLEDSSIRVEEQVVQNVTENGEHHGSKECRQETTD